MSIVFGGSLTTALASVFQPGTCFKPRLENLLGGTSGIHMQGVTLKHTDFGYQLEELGPSGSKRGGQIEIVTYAFSQDGYLLGTYDEYGEGIQRIPAIELAQNLQNIQRLLRVLQQSFG